jgi:glycosyltransferase involved in cell wall biosynthesis
MAKVSQRKIRVLQLIHSFSLGGAERVVTTLAVNMDRTRFEVIPCAIESSGPFEEDLKAGGVQYRVLGHRRRSILTGPLFLADCRRLLVALTELLNELSIDIVHTHLTQTSLLGILAARRVGTPRVCATVHSVVMSSRQGRWNPRGFLLRSAINKVFSQADRIIAVSQEVDRAIRLHTGIPGERILTIPNGVDTDQFHLQADRRTLRDRLGLPADRLVAVTIGRLTHLKGHTYLQGALASIPAEQRPLVLIAGDGPDRNALELRTTAMELNRDIRFLGNRRDIPALLAAADLFVLPSLWEGLPLVLLEAMAAGLPAVVTAVGGNPEVVGNGIAGVLVPPGDAHALAKALSSLLNDPLRRERMGQAARQRVERYFSVQKFVEAHEQLYEVLFAEHSSRSARSI